MPRRNNRRGHSEIAQIRTSIPISKNNKNKQFQGFFKEKKKQGDKLISHNIKSKYYFLAEERQLSVFMRIS